MSLRQVFDKLHAHYGPQHWWPSDTPFEVMVGAVLTQNTAWSNVEKAVASLKRERLMTPTGLDRAPGRRLAALIRPSGYYNIKAKRLKNLAGFIRDRYCGSLRRMFSSDPGDLRKGLLQ